MSEENVAQKAGRHQYIGDSSRRLLLKSMLMLFIGRLDRDIPVTQTDLLRAAYYGEGDSNEE